MNKKLQVAFTLLLLITGIPGCKTSHTNSTKKNITERADPAKKNNKVIIGFNQNWSFLPQLDDSILVNNIKKLSPKMIRFPGGTTTHKWDWKAGKITMQQKISEYHPLIDVKRLVIETGAKLMIVLDIVHSTLANQIEMLDSLNSLGLPIEYIELGNELYSKDPKLNYALIFPDGAAYADSVSKWVPTLKARYPKAKIAALLIAKTGSDTRMNAWNRMVSHFIDSAHVAVDAYTYHLYINKGSNYKDRIADFNLAKIPTPGKELWATEYGNMNDVTDSDYLVELNKLADYVEANFSISLNHTIIGNQTKHAKLEPSTKGQLFTAEGEMFLKRVNR